MPQKLSFRARGTDMVQDLEAMEAGIRRYIGRKAVNKDGAQAGSVADLVGWVSTDAAQEVPYRHEYVRAARDGGLWCADKATADACGVEFDPSFGAAPKPKDSTKGDSK